MNRLGIDVKALLAEVRANFARLDGCAGPHDFSIEVRKTGSIVMTRGCTICGGTIQASEARWYERGLAHGRKSE